MNRREAIKTLISFSAIAILPKIVLSHIPAPSKFHFVGLGNGGLNALTHIYDKGVKAGYTCITNSERPRLPTEIEFIKFNSPEEYQFRRNFEAHIFLPTQIENVFREDSDYVLLVALGGYTGTNLTKELSKYLSDRNKKFMIIGCLPFLFEGNKRISFAARTKHELNRYSNFYYFEMGDITRFHGDMLLSEAFQKADERYYEIFKEKHSQCFADNIFSIPR